MFNIFKKKSQSVDPRLKQIFEWGGHKFYTVSGDLIEENFMKRYAYYLRIVKAADGFKIDEIKLERILNDMENAINAGDSSRCAQLIMFLRSLHEATAIDEQYFRIANCFLWVEGEPLRDFSAEHTELKKNLYKNHDDVKFFFRSFAHEYLKHTLNISENTSFEAYLATSQNQIINALSLKLEHPIM